MFTLNFVSKDNDSRLHLKKSEKIFGYYLKKPLSLQRFSKESMMFGLWCNGSTTGFGSVCPSSNLGSPTQIAVRNKSDGYLRLYTLLS